MEQQIDVSLSSPPLSLSSPLSFSNQYIKKLILVSKVHYHQWDYYVYHMYNLVEVCFQIISFSQLLSKGSFQQSPTLFPALSCKMQILEVQEMVF